MRAIIQGTALPLLIYLLAASFVIHNVPYYSLTNFRHALIVLPLCYLLALIIATGLLKESYKSHK